MRLARHTKIDWDSPEYKQARFHYLLQILFGESLAENYCLRMSEFAPSQEARDFLVVQNREESAHLELLTEAVAGMERSPDHVSAHLRKLHSIMEGVLARKDWAGAIFVQNFIVEGLVVTLFREQKKYADPVIEDVFSKIIGDEIRHVAFGIEELRKVLAEDQGGSIARHLVSLQRQTLFHAVLFFNDLAWDADDLGMHWDDLARTVVEDHTERIQRAGLHLPAVDRLFLRAAYLFFKYV